MEQNIWANHILLMCGTVAMLFPFGLTPALSMAPT